MNTSTDSVTTGHMEAYLVVVSKWPRRYVLKRVVVAMIDPSEDSAGGLCCDCRGVQCSVVNHVSEAQS
jgi:hypothetical protein